MYIYTDIFLVNIKKRVDYALGVCVNAENSAINKANYIKFGMMDPMYIPDAGKEYFK